LIHKTSIPAMEQFIIKLKDQKRRFFLIELLKQLDFIEIESTDQKEIQVNDGVEATSAKKFTVLEVSPKIASNYKFDRYQANER